MTTTPHYQLNQWDAEDYIRRVDFNRDNERIEAAMLAQSKEMDSKVSACTNSIQAENAAWRAALSAETSARKEADTAEVSARNTAIAAETSARNAAIAAETSARSAAINAEVSARNSAISSAISSEVSKRDQAIQSAINTEVSNRNFAVANEREAWQLAMSQEAAARDNAITDERVDRVTAVSNLQKTMEAKVAKVESARFQLLQDIVIQQEGIMQVSIQTPSSYWSDWKTICFVLNLNNPVTYRLENPDTPVLNLRMTDWRIAMQPHYDPSFPVVTDYVSQLDIGTVVSVKQRFEDIHTVYFVLLKLNTGFTAMQIGSRFRVYGEK